MNFPEMFQHQMVWTSPNLCLDTTEISGLSVLQMIMLCVKVGQMSMGAETVSNKDTPLLGEREFCNYEKMTCRCRLVCLSTNSKDAASNIVIFVSSRNA